MKDHFLSGLNHLLKDEEVARSPGGETRQAKQSRVRELTQQFPQVWVEDNPPQACKTSSTGNRTQTLKPGTIMSTPALGLPDLAKLLTLYMTEKDKVAMGVVSQTMGTWGRPLTYL